MATHNFQTKEHGASASRKSYWSCPTCSRTIPSERAIRQFWGRDTLCVCPHCNHVIGQEFASMPVPVDNDELLERAVGV